MSAHSDHELRALRLLKMLAYSNALIWILAMIGLVFVISRDPGAKGLFPVLAVGCAVGVGLVTQLPALDR